MEIEWDILAIGVVRTSAMITKWTWCNILATWDGADCVLLQCLGAFRSNGMG